MEYISLKLEEVALFYTEEKLVFAIDKSRQKYVVDKNLSTLEAGLDNLMFFRANRKYIVNIDFVKGYKPYQKVKLDSRYDFAGLKSFYYREPGNGTIFSEMDCRDVK